MTVNQEHVSAFQSRITPAAEHRVVAPIVSQLVVALPHQRLGTQSYEQSDSATMLLCEDLQSKNS